MSSHPKREDRRADDLYETPKKEARLLVEFAARFGTVRGPRTLEPSAGPGRVARAVVGLAPSALVINEPFNQVGAWYLDAKSPRIHVTSERFEDLSAGSFDLIIGNPPFKLAQSHVERAISMLSPRGIAVFLLRSGFAHGQRRFDSFTGRHAPFAEYRLIKRPSFTDGGTDSTEYSIFGWRKRPRVGPWQCEAVDNR